MQPWAFGPEVKDKPFTCNDLSALGQWPTTWGCELAWTCEWFRSSKDETVGSAAKRIFKLLGECVDQAPWLRKINKQDPMLNPILQPPQAKRKAQGKVWNDMCCKVEIKLLRERVQAGCWANADGYIELPVGGTGKVPRKCSADNILPTRVRVKDTLLPGVKFIRLHKLLVWLWLGWKPYKVGQEAKETLHLCHFKCCGSIHHLCVNTHQHNLQEQFCKSVDIANMAQRDADIAALEALEAFCKLRI